ncbi:MAG: hypothetical protein M1570_00715 [Chloroflexi bacterium]|nr:hypothetical protein [Chloroflexota bacterium]
MNELARVVHDLVTGSANLSSELARLSPQERAALADLQKLITRSPSELAALLAKDEPTIVWYGPLPAADPPKLS